MTIEVVTRQEAERANAVVCCRVGMPRYFTDDIESKCAHCGHGIFYRPHVPKKPIKICIQCAQDLMRGGRA